MALYQETVWEGYHQTKRNRDDEAYWDRRAIGFSRHAGVSNYSKEFIELCRLHPDWTVLDVGCGSGSLTLEIAQRTRQVTGLDISGKMLELLRSQARTRGINNISTIKAAWEDDWNQHNVPQADLVIESRALLTPDLPAALRKLATRARKRVCLTTVCGDLAYGDRRVIESIGRSLPHPPDYIHVVNCLYDMGIKADVDFISSVKYDSYCSRDAAKQSLLKMLGGSVNAREDRLLDAFLDKHLIRTGEREWAKDYERKTDWAFISWNVRQ